MIRLVDPAGGERILPGERHMLVGVVGPDCHACELTLPLLLAASEAFSGPVDVAAVSVDAAFAGRAIGLVEGKLPVLLDEGHLLATALGTSVLPHIALVAPDGVVVAEFAGFDRGEWQAMFGRLISKALSPAPLVDWPQLPESEPGCRIAPDSH